MALVSLAKLPVAGEMGSRNKFDSYAVAVYNTFYTPFPRFWNVVCRVSRHQEPAWRALPDLGEA